MPAKHQFVRIRISKEYGPTERLAIAQDIIDRIRDRTAKGLNKDGDPFPGYSKSYRASTEFKIAGKSASRVNLTLSGDMLTALGILDESSGAITIGFQPGTSENARADGNIRGTYGKATGNARKARPFLGITESELKSILSSYPLSDRQESKAEAAKVVQKSEEVRAFVEGGD